MRAPCPSHPIGAVKWFWLSFLSYPLQWMWKSGLKKVLLRMYGAAAFMLAVWGVPIAYMTLHPDHPDVPNTLLCVSWAVTGVVACASLIWHAVWVVLDLDD